MILYADGEVSFAVRSLGEGLDSYQVDYRAVCDIIDPREEKKKVEANGDESCNMVLPRCRKLQT